MIELKKLAEGQEIWNEEEDAKLEAEVRKLVLECFHKQIQVFGKKTNKKMSTRKL